MLLRLPTSVSEARECLAEGAVPVGGATLVWAEWQRDGFPALAMSLRGVPEANEVGAGVLGSAVVLNRMSDAVPDVLRLAAATIGTGAVRRTATVGGNVVGSSLRCLLPPALVLDARATVLGPEGTHEAELSEVVAKRPLLLALRWRDPVASAYRKLPAPAGGPPPRVIALAVHDGDGDGDGDGRLVRVAVREGYDVLSGTVPGAAGTGTVLEALRETLLGELPSDAWELVERETTALLDRLPRP
ncbi:FAD binding domain-containing protein [Streptomyces sp. J2-1]|uniref:FAD binding domain-containing protein n=1 Tax=Streptomyces corallincola TaxID=2851888 RepID=UPI001C384AF3|nr:FAD binding domain-containing protein [Streptomyces corallincola]MBV2354078.1 FAD binding domain-containing protein [Streptomyces corallincola]